MCIYLVGWVVFTTAFETVARRMEEREWRCRVVSFSEEYMYSEKTRRFAQYA